MGDREFKSKYSVNVDESKSVTGAEVTSKAFDIKTANCATCEVIVSGLSGSEKFTLNLQEGTDSTDNDTFVDIAKDKQVNNINKPLEINSNGIHSIAYVGGSPYLKLKVVPTGTISASFVPLVRLDELKSAPPD